MNITEKKKNFFNKKIYKTGRSTYPHIDSAELIYLVNQHLIIMIISLIN